MADETQILVGILIFYSILAIVVPVMNLEFNQSMPELEWDSAFNVVTSSFTLIYYSVTGIPWWLAIIMSLPSIVLMVLVYRLLRGF